MEIIVTKFDWDKFDQLKNDHWRVLDYSNNLYECKLHNTIFNPIEEPCWGCHNICETIIKGTKNENI
jgi:hypothetical protein